MGWFEAAIAWMNGLGVIGDALVTAIGTIVAAVLAVLSGVWTYVLNKRREAALAKAERDAERQREERARSERINDIVRALHAEILTGIVLYEDQMDAAEVRHTIFDPTPFATPDEVDFVFDTVVPDLSILPSDVIHQVVAYYRVARQTNLMIRDFRDPRFEAQSAEEKRRFLEGYIQLVFVLKRRGDEAVAALANYAKEQKVDLESAERKVRAITREALAQASNAIVAARSLGPEPSHHRADGA